MEDNMNYKEGNLKLMKTKTKQKKHTKQMKSSKSSKSHFILASLLKMTTLI